MTSYSEFVLGTDRESHADACRLLLGSNSSKLCLHAIPIIADYGTAGRIRRHVSRTPFRIQATARNSWAATARPKLQRRCGGRRFRIARAPVSIHAERCRRNSSLVQGEEKTVILMLGQADDAEHARRLIARYRDPANVEQALAETRRVVGSPPDHDSGQDAGAFGGFHDESLAALSVAELPHLGTIRFVSIERRVWFSRPVAGFAGACLFRAGYRARDDSAGRFAAVCRRRRAALVASAFR